MVSASARRIFLWHGPVFYLLQKAGFMDFPCFKPGCVLPRTGSRSQLLRPPVCPDRILHPPIPMTARLPCWEGIKVVAWWYPDGRGEDRPHTPWKETETQNHTHRGKTLRVLKGPQADRHYFGCLFSALENQHFCVSTCLCTRDAILFLTPTVRQKFSRRNFFWHGGTVIGKSVLMTVNFCPPKSPLKTLEQG